MVNASEVIKVKTLTIREIFAFLKQEQAQANGDIGAHHEMPTPQCLLDIIGQTHKFRVKFPGASVACESALGSTCSGGPSCEASAPNSAIGEKEVCKTQ
ncbi:unnamed protein product [Brassica rapa subsp. narinosa]|uniref:(rape) hypothetical protein n=1 Tax=Brassica napus TaxID=3708 RepID=A0A816YS20_BRANA|nr:unnamed protein product [Brassica napus]